MAISCAASFIFSFIGLLSKPPDPDDPGFGPVCLHLLFFGGRTAILVSGLIPTNVLRLIWVQHKRDDNGGVVISMLAVLMYVFPISHSYLLTPPLPRFSFSRN